MLVLHLDQLRAYALAAVAAGSDVSVQQFVDDFEASLVEVPQVVDADRAELRQVLGV